MALRNAFENLGLDSTLQAIRDRLPAALGGNGGIKVEQQGAVTSKLQDGSGNAITSTSSALDVNVKSGGGANTVTGNVASGAADSGNPVKVGGKYNSTLPTFTDGQRGDLQVNSKGSLNVSLTRASDGGALAALQPADSTTNANTGLAVAPFNQVYNGSTWDRMRSATAAANTSGTGLVGVGNLGFDGTNWQSVGGAVGDSGQNSLITSGSRKEVAFSVTTAQALASVDVSNYAWVSVHIVTQTGTIQFQGSNDNSNWVQITLQNQAGSANTPSQTTSSAGVIFSGPLNYRYFRLNISVVTSGTTAGVVEYFSIAKTIMLGPSIGATADAITGGSTSPATTYVWNGVSWDRIRSDGTTGGQGVGGTVAAGSADSGNPVKYGGVGKTANPAAVTDGQRVNAVFDKLGKQVVVNSIRDLKGVQQTTITSSVAETTIVTAVASTFLDVYGLILTNNSATATTVTIKDATAGTTRAVFVVPASDTRGLMLTESAAMPQAAVNNNWTATCGTSVASLQVTALYVKNT